MVERQRDTADAFRAAIAAQICPWCGRGPFLLLAGHTQRIHDVTAVELRELAGLTKIAFICDPTHAAAVVDRNRGKALPAVAYERARAAKRSYSPAGRDAQRAKLERAQAPAGGPMEFARRGAAAAKEKRAKARAPAYAAIVRAFDEGMLLKDIRERLGVSKSMIRRALQQADRRVDGRARRWQLPDERERDVSFGQSGGRAVRALHAAETAALVARFVEAGATYAAVKLLAKQQGISTKSMAARLRAAGALVPDGRRRQARSGSATAD